MPASGKARKENASPGLMPPHVAFSRPTDRMRAQQIMAQPQPLRIGTRGSPMALIQAGMVRDRLAAEHRDLAAPDAIEIIVIRTTGDRVQDRPLYEIGGKALFPKAIEEPLLHGATHLPVHSTN